MPYEKVDEEVSATGVHYDWSKIGQVRAIGWGVRREDGGPDGIALEVHFPDMDEPRIVALDPEDVAAILDEVVAQAGGAKAH